jgi:hypothetical protein
MSTDNNNQNLRVFISYARQDTEAANRLYNDLKLSGLEPWLDTESLLGGENWRISIKEAIRNSRYFVALLSSNSVEKIGYVQRIERSTGSSSGVSSIKEIHNTCAFG